MNYIVIDNDEPKFGRFKLYIGSNYIRDFDFFSDPFAYILLTCTKKANIKLVVLKKGIIYNFGINSYTTMDSILNLLKKIEQ